MHHLVRPLPRLHTPWVHVHWPRLAWHHACWEWWEGLTWHVHHHGLSTSSRAATRTRRPCLHVHSMLSTWRHGSILTHHGHAIRALRTQWHTNMHLARAHRTGHARLHRHLHLTRNTALKMHGWRPLGVTRRSRATLLHARRSHARCRVHARPTIMWARRHLHDCLHHHPWRWWWWHVALHLLTTRPHVRHTRHVPMRRRHRPMHGAIGEWPSYTHLVPSLWPHVSHSHGLWAGHVHMGQRRMWHVAHMTGRRPLHVPARPWHRHGTWGWHHAHHRTGHASCWPMAKNWPRRRGCGARL